MIFRKTTVATLLILFIMAAAGNGANGQKGTIMVADLRMRSGPGTDYRVVASLEKGATVPILDRENEWLKISHNGVEGYILGREAFVAVTGPATPEPAKIPEKLKPSEENAETIARQLRQAQSDLDKITRKERDVVEAFNTAEEALNSTRRQVRVAESELNALLEKIDAIEAQSRSLENEIRAQEAYAAERLTALYKLNWVGRIHLLATADSFFDFMRRRAALNKILDQDETLLDALNDGKTALETLLTELNAKKAEQRSLELSLKERLDYLDTQQKERKSLLEKIRGKKSLELAALEALRQAAKDLNAVVDRMGASAVKASIPGKTGSGDKSFQSYKGLLSWPVKGKIISFFGPYRDNKYKVTNFQSGIEISAERGEPIRCVSDGYTIYSNWFKGFGNMMIIDHGDHYYTVYAHLEEVFKVKGDRVEKNEVIATVGDSGSMMGPALHFEVRHHGKPIDPMEWIQNG